MNTETIILISISISMILYYIYETDVVWEYLNKIALFFNKLFKTEKFFYGRLMLKAYPDNQSKNYIEFINKIYNNFFTRLISCPICFGFWISLGFSIMTNIAYMGVYAYFSLVLYYVIKFLTKI